MLTLKFMKYETTEGAPSSTSNVVLHSTRNGVYISFDKHNRTVVEFEDASGERHDVTVGDSGRDDVSFNACYVMNEHGKTVETLR